jgi:hypothetical protein
VTLYHHAMAELTTQECCDLYEEITGRKIKPSTWRSYVARDQAPKPKRHIGRTPLWDKATVVRHLMVLPRIGTVKPDVD